MATIAPGGRERRSGNDGHDLREPELIERRGTSLRHRIAVAAFVVFVTFWLYVLFIAPSAPLDKLSDGTFPAAAEPVCKATLDDLSRLGLVNQRAATPQERAVLVDRTDVELRKMVAQLRTLLPADPEDAAAVSAWLVDWDQWLSDHATWSAQLHRGENAQFFEKQRDTGEPNSKALNDFALINEMPSCATPGGV